MRAVHRRRYSPPTLEGPRVNSTLHKNAGFSFSYLFLLPSSSNAVPHTELGPPETQTTTPCSPHTMTLVSSRTPRLSRPPAHGPSPNCRLAATWPSHRSRLRSTCSWPSDTGAGAGGCSAMEDLDGCVTVQPGCWESVIALQRNNGDQRGTPAVAAHPYSLVHPYSRPTVSISQLPLRGYPYSLVPRPPSSRPQLTHTPAGPHPPLIHTPS